MRLQQEIARTHDVSSLTHPPTSPQLQDDRQRTVLLYGKEASTDRLIFRLRNAGWDVKVAWKASSAASFIEHCACCVAIASIDKHCKKSDLEEIERVLSGNDTLLWIALLAEQVGNDHAIDRLISTYCHDYYTWPCDMDKLLGTLGHAYGIQQLQKRNCRSDADTEMNGLVGTSEPMRNLHQAIRKAACVDATVLLTGESGSGKELTANAIHELSSRSGQPFVSVNCAALPTDLIHSELFGHEKGSFTGACKRHIGYFEAANLGTIFLDEIGDLPTDLQINLLRFLEEMVIGRIGSTDKLHINTRVIAATNKNLEILVKEGRFREDLYYRLHVLHIRVPSLIEHLDDVELIAEHIYQQHIDEKRPRIRGFSKQALSALHHYNWPGNVRELTNRVRHAMVMSDGRLISPADLGLTEEKQQQTTVTLENSRTQAAREAIEAALKNTCSNISQAARELGVSRTTLYRLMDKFSIEV
jgi:DNA-binding NtrC family response regulator